MAGILGPWELLGLGPAGALEALGIFGPRTAGWCFWDCGNFWSSDRWLVLLKPWEFLVLGPLVGAFEALGIFGPRTAGFFYNTSLKKLWRPCEFLVLGPLAGAFGTVGIFGPRTAGWCF